MNEQQKKEFEARCGVTVEQMDELLDSVEIYLLNNGPVPIPPMTNYERNHTESV